MGSSSVSYFYTKCVDQHSQAVLPLLLLTSSRTQARLGGWSEVWQLASHASNLSLNSSHTLASFRH
jgi:hypothetical protein